MYNCHSFLTKALIHSLNPRRYNPCRVLADSRSRLQPSMSLVLILQFLTPSLSASLITPSIHLRFGLPTRLLPSGLSKVIFLHSYIILNSYYIYYPSTLDYRNCCYQISLIAQTIEFFIISWSPCCPFTDRSIVLLNINSSALLRTQVSAPYIRNGFINVLYIITLNFLFMFLSVYWQS